MNTFEKIAHALSQTSGPIPEVEEKAHINRQERRFEESRRRKFYAKLMHRFYVLNDRQQRPTAHKMPKPRPGCTGK